MRTLSILLFLGVTTEASAVTFSGTATSICQDEWPYGAETSQSEVSWSLTWDPTAPVDSMSFVEEGRYFGNPPTLVHTGWVLDIQGGGVITVTVDGVTYAGSGQAFLEDGIELPDGTLWQDVVSLSTSDHPNQGFAFTLLQDDTADGDLIGGLDAEGNYDYRPFGASTSTMYGTLWGEDGSACSFSTQTMSIETDGDGHCDVDDTDDLDGDGFADDCDTCPDDVANDGDDDGICDGDDNCLGTSNSDQIDTNDNGLGDACEPDADGDGWFDYDDNCPLHANPGQEDVDGDGVGDACDQDGDDDGVSDDIDACLNTPEGEVVDSTGCSIAQICPCDAAWKNKGAYQSCVAKTADAFEDASLITSDEGDEVVSEAAGSTCARR